MTSKIIAKVIFKPKPGVKNYIHKYDDNSILMETLFLTGAIEEYTLDKLLCSKFGKHLYLRVARISSGTITVLDEIINNDSLKGLCTIEINNHTKL